MILVVETSRKIVRNDSTGRQYGPHFLYVACLLLKTMRGMSQAMAMVSCFVAPPPATVTWPLMHTPSSFSVHATNTRGITDDSPWELLSHGVSSPAGDNEMCDAATLQHSI